MILVDGALCYRSLGPSAPLAKLLAQQFTVYTYARRGRGESGDTAPHSIEREIDDLDALITAAGDRVFLWAVSSGVVLALEAARRGANIRKLALYEPPFIVDSTRPPTTDAWREIGDAVKAGHRSKAVKIFLKAVGAPAFFVAVMPLLPVWSKLKAIAHTLPYDGAIVKNYQRGHALPADRWASVTMPTLVMVGGKSPRWMRNGTRALAAVLPNSQYRTLEGEIHNLRAKVHAPVLAEWFNP